MTFGEKLYRLRKTHGLSQEALAEKLHTSRQAVSKWENNNGYPETEKIILISRMFQITLDDLLLDDREPDAMEERKPAKEAKGFYISRETANGFLLYYKRKFLLLAAACGVIAGCNGAYYGSTEPNFYESVISPVLTTVSGVMLLFLVIYIVLKQNPYRTLRKKELVFAEDVRKELEEEFSRMKKVLLTGIGACLTIFGISEAYFSIDRFGETMYLLSDAELIRETVFDMLLVGVCSFVTVFCVGVYWSYAVLLRRNGGYEEY